MKILIVEDRPDYLKVWYVSPLSIDYWGTHTVSLILTAQIKIIVRVYLWSLKKALWIWLHTNGWVQTEDFMQSSRPIHLYRSKNGRPSISGAVNLVLSLYQTLSYVWIILLILQKPFEVANKSLVWNLLKIKSLVNSWHFKLTLWTSFRSIISLKISILKWI